jgi:hypothetical protein
MSSSPSTFKGEPAHPGIDWDDPSSLHRSDDGGGLLNGLKSIRQGGLAELIRFVLTLPEAERSRYVIDKSGDHRLMIGEILALSRRPDFPKA